jgi:hypothetical protein
MNVRIMLVVNKFLALVFRSKARFDSLAVLPGSAREPVSDPDVEHRVIAIGNDVDPEVVITGHHSEFKFRDVSTSLDMTNKTPIRIIRVIRGCVQKVKRSISTVAETSTCSVPTMKFSAPAPCWPGDACGLGVGVGAPVLSRGGPLSFSLCT